MNMVTCQASACRYTRSRLGLAGSCPGMGPGPVLRGTAASGGAVSGAASGPGGMVRYLRGGSQATAATMAGTAHKPRASRTDPPEARYTGTAISELRIEPPDTLSR